MTAQFTETQTEIIAISNLIVAIISILGASLIILIYLKVKKSRSYAFRLVLYLSIANLITSIMDITDSITTLASSSYFSTLYCDMEATTREFCQIFLILFNAVICWILFISAIYNPDRNQIEKKGHILTIAALILSALFAVIPYFGNAYGRAGSAWCWINNSVDGALWYVLGELYIPFWLTAIFAVVCYIKIYLTIRQEPENINFIALVQKLWWFPIVDIICYTAATVHRFYVIFSQRDSFVLCMFHVWIGHSQGFFNALIVFWIRGYESKAFFQYIGCCGGEVAPEEEESFIDRNSQRTASEVVSEYIKIYQTEKMSDADMSY